MLNCWYIISYNPAIIALVWFWLQVTSIIWIKPVFTITQYGFIVNRQTWKESSILQLGVITSFLHSHGWKERGNKYFLCYKQPWSYIQVLYLGIMTHPAINRQDPFSISCMQEQVNIHPLRIMHIITIPKAWRVISIQQHKYARWHNRQSVWTSLLQGVFQPT